MTGRHSSFDKLLQFLSSLKCGLLLLGLLGISMILGTLILQRPMAQEGQIEQIYAPQVVRLLNMLGLFDVFHTWWFILLLGLLGANITLASIERFPQVWRLFARPHYLADAAYVRALPFQREIPLGPHTPQEAISLAARKFEVVGYPPRKDVLPKGTLYVEKHRAARLAPYVVHASLLIVFSGAIYDGLRGYKGFISLRPGMSTDYIEPLTTTGPRHHLDFTLRCDAAGMDAYPDGSPRQYWSQLTVLEDGREVSHKKIFVNDPLTYKGIRFFQASYIPSGAPSKLVMEASWLENSAQKHQTLTLIPGSPSPLDDHGSAVELADFIPDYVLEGNQIVSRSDEPRNPAIQVQVTRPGAQPTHAWILAKSPELKPPNDTGIDFHFVSVEMAATTGLQVAHEPGQWLIWTGCLLLTGGLMMALYLSHIRIWGVAGVDRKGRPALLLGGQPSKYRENFEHKFNELANEVEAALVKVPAELVDDAHAA
ncbi:MAG TPA: cytochrome c biogenesis protein ResB [Terriglobia bacterium]|nr:cytochrome c biogenesis protein ResB [Terriglobia bacterium]